jgi:hypothetical protein
MALYTILKFFETSKNGNADRRTWRYEMVQHEFGQLNSYRLILHETNIESLSTAASLGP